MNLTGLLQIVEKLQQVSKIDSLQQVCDVFGCVLETHLILVKILPLFKNQNVGETDTQRKSCAENKHRRESFQWRV